MFSKGANIMKHRYIALMFIAAGIAVLVKLAWFNADKQIAHLALGSFLVVALVLIAVGILYLVLSIRWERADTLYYREYDMPEQTSLPHRQQDTTKIVEQRPVGQH